MNTLTSSKFVAKWIRLLSFFVVGFFGFTTVLHAATPEEEFQFARNSYEYASYKQAIQRLERLLARIGKTLQKTEKFTAKYQKLIDIRKKSFKYLGLSYFYRFLSSKKTKYKLKAGEHFRDYLFEEPKAKLDPALYRPELIAFFEKIRKQNAARLALIIQKKNNRKANTSGRYRIVQLRVERHVYKHHRLVSLLPFGIAQFANREPVKGGLILGGELAALALNVTAYLVLVSMQVKEGVQKGRFKTEDINEANRWQIVQFASFGVFAAIAVYGLIDGVISYRSERVSVIPQLPAVNPSRFRIRRSSQTPHKIPKTNNISFQFKFESE